jgi:hypothetical protein
MAEDDFKAEVEVFLIRHDMKPAAFGALALKDPKFVFDLRKGRSPSMKTIDRVRRFMADHEAPQMVEPVPLTEPVPTEPVPVALPQTVEPPRMEEPGIEEKARDTKTQPPREKRRGCGGLFLFLVLLALVLSAIGIAALKPGLALCAVAGISRLAGGAGAVPMASRPAGTDMAQLTALTDALQGDYNEMRRQVAAMGMRLDDAAKRIEALEGSGTAAGAAAPDGGRLAAIENRLTALENRPAAPGSGTENPSLDERLSHLEQQMAGAQHDLSVLEEQADQVMNAEQPQIQIEMQIADNADAIATLKGDVAGLKQTLTGLDSQSLGTLQKEVSQSAVTASFLRLDAAVRSGNPYDSALDLYRNEVAAAPGDWPSADALQSAAATGIASASALQESFQTLTPALLADEDEGKSWTDRLLSRLKSVVVIRKKGEAVEETAGPDAIIEEAGAAVDSGDFDAAVTALETLPPPVLAKAENWIATAKVRHDALGALAGMAQALSLPEAR